MSGGARSSSIGRLSAPSAVCTHGSKSHTRVLPGGRASRETTETVPDRLRRATHAHLVLAVLVVAVLKGVRSDRQSGNVTCVSAGRQAHAEGSPLAAFVAAKARQSSREAVEPPHSEAGARNNARHLPNTRRARTLSSYLGAYLSSYLPYLSCERRSISKGTREGQAVVVCTFDSHSSRA